MSQKEDEAKKDPVDLSNRSEILLNPFFSSPQGETRAETKKTQCSPPTARKGNYILTMREATPARPAVKRATMLLRLQALRVPGVELLASAGRAAGGAAPALATALAPHAGAVAAGVRSRDGVGLGLGSRAGAGAGSGRAAGLGVVGGADGAEADVGPDDLGVGVVLDDVGGGAAGLGAAATESARDTLLLGGVEGVEPEHVGVVVGPDGEDEDHGHTEGSVELGVAADLAVAVAVLEDGGVGRAELGGDLGIELGQAVKLGSRGGDDLAVLDEDLVGTVLLEAGDDTAPNTLVRGRYGGGREKRRREDEYRRT